MATTSAANDPDCRYSAETPSTDTPSKATLLVLEASTEISQQTFRNIMIPYGTVDQGQIVKVLLTVKNSMEEPFYFDAAVPSCTCTFFDTPAKSINPGEAIVMEFRFKSNSDPIKLEELEISVASGFKKTDLSFLVKPVAGGYGYNAVLTNDVGNDRGFGSGILRLEVVAKN